MSDETGSKTERKSASEDVRRAILDSATEVFSQRGFKGASLREIAQGAGLKSHTHIYWYFRDKSELLTTVLRGDIESTRVPDFEALRDLPIHRALERVARSYLRAFEDPRGRALFRILLSESARDPAVQEEFGKTTRTTSINVLTELFEHHTRLGTLSVTQPRAQATHFWGQLVAFVSIREIAPHLAGALPDLDGYVDLAVDTLLDGIRCTSDAARD